MCIRDRLEFHAQKQRVFHFPLRRARMRAHAAYRQLERRGVERLVADFADLAAVYRIGRFRAKYTAVEKRRCV